MNRLLLLAALSMASLTAIAPQAGAQVTPTHTFETPAKFNPFNSQVIFATMIAPPAGETILRAELHITWTSTATQSAAKFGMHLNTALEYGVSPDWSITGGALGWGATPGTYSAVVSTDLLNGTLAPGPFGFPPVLNVTLEAAGGGGLTGTLSKASKIVFFLGPKVKVDTPSVSLSAGGTQNFSLNAGPTIGPGKLYFLGGSASGTAPGLVINNIPIPLVLDSYTQLTISMANVGPFVNTLGVLDGTGRANASLVVPALTDPALAGLVLHHSLLVLNPFQNVLLSASDPVSLTLLP